MRHRLPGERIRSEEINSSSRYPRHDSPVVQSPDL
ncbi:MAG: hypothetical protein QOJ68_2898 [Blastococcus sp.]|jgi:hypothetical protein|nr:hypothetical protein [Blastococcus sp.]